MQPGYEIPAAAFDVSTPPHPYVRLGPENPAADPGDISPAMKTPLILTNTPIILSTLAAGALALTAVAQQDAPNQSEVRKQPQIDTNTGTQSIAPSATDRANAEVLFRRLDSNGDGAISREEFSRNAHLLPIGPQPGANVTSPGPATSGTSRQDTSRSTETSRATDATGATDTPGSRK
jgi:hypothetical protein